MKQIIACMSLLLGCGALYGVGAHAQQAGKAATPPTKTTTTPKAAVAPKAAAPKAAAPAARRAVAKAAAPTTKVAKPEIAADSLLKQVLTSRVLRVCVRTDIPPFGFLRGRTLQGFDLALAEELVTQLSIRFQTRLKIDWVIVRAEGRISSLQNGRCDMVTAAFSKTVKRAKQVLFTRVYFGTKKVLLKRAGDVGEKPIVAQVRKTTSAALGLAGATYSSFLSYRDILYTMRQKLVDYVVADKPTGLYLARKSKGAYQVHRVLAQQELYSIGLAKKSVELAQELNKALTKLEQNGRLAYLQQKWLR